MWAGMHPLDIFIRVRNPDISVIFEYVLATKHTEDVVN